MHTNDPCGWAGSLDLFCLHMHSAAGRAATGQADILTSPWEYRLSTQPNVYGDVLLDTGSSCCLSMAVGVRALLFPGGLDSFKLHLPEEFRTGQLTSMIAGS